MLQRRHGADRRDDAAGEGVPTEAEIPQHSQPDQSGELQIADEAEAGEIDAGDGGGGAVAGDSVPFGQAAVLIAVGREVPRSRYKV